MEQQNSQFNSPQVNPINLAPAPVNPKKEKSKLIPLISAIVLTAVIVGGGVYWWINNNQARIIPSDNNQTFLSITTQADNPNWKTYQNSSFKVSYPTDTFTASNLNNGVSLMSDVFVNENSKGVGEGITQTFSINFYIGGPLLGEIKKFSVPEFFSEAFPDGTVESFNANINNGFIESFSAAGRNGFMFTSGLEGIYTNYYFYP